MESTYNVYGNAQNTKWDLNIWHPRTGPWVKMEHTLGIDPPPVDLIRGHCVNFWISTQKPVYRGLNSKIKPNWKFEKFSFVYGTSVYLGLWAVVQKSLLCSLMDSSGGSYSSMVHFGPVVWPVGGLLQFLVRPHLVFPAYL